jgi:hypothetical protein
MRKILLACSGPDVISRGSFCRSLEEISESRLGFVQAFVDSIHHTSEGRGLINARSSTGG